jgi:4-carboxymuconolactone decarboxylase
MSVAERMPKIPNNRMTQPQKKAYAEIVSGPRGAVDGPYIPLLRSPELMSRLQKTGEYLRYRSGLPKKLSELAILIIARQWTQRVEWARHYPIALGQGLRPQTADAIARGRRPAEMTEEEETVYEFCQELRETQSVSDATYESALASIGEQGIIDLIGVIGYHTWTAMLMNVARNGVPEEQAPGRVGDRPADLVAGTESVLSSGTHSM